MGEVYREFEDELRAYAERFAGRPDQELLAFLLMGLEREQIVATGYRGGIIREKLDAMPIPEEVREVLRHALIWVWKDEEMHAVFLRGLLLRNGSLATRARALAAQISGAVGGWSASTLHHRRFAEAPLLVSAASALTRVGALAGKVPEEVAEALDFRGFRHYCLFNLDAELTAARCFDRMVEIARASDADPELIEELAGMARDEDEHAKVFAAFIASIDDDDRIVPGVTADALAERLRAVNEVYVARERRSVSEVASPLGTGGEVHALAGAAGDDKRVALETILDRAELDARLRARAAELDRPLHRMRIAIKPSFMMGYRREDRATHTDPDLVDALARRLRALGVADVAAVEGPNLYDVFFDRRDVRSVARYLGYGGTGYRVIDASTEQIPHRFARGMAHDTVSRTWAEADFRIAFGKLRGHPTEHLWSTLATVEGLGPRHDRYMFAERQAQRHSATMTLLADFPFHFAILEGWDVAADGLFGMYGAARPRHPRRLWAGADAIAVDIAAARAAGVPEPTATRVTAAACHWFGDPSGRMRVVGATDPIPRWRHPRSDPLSTALSLMADPMYVLASGRGSLFLAAMDEEAFPPLRGHGPPMRMARWALRRFFNMRR